MALAQLAQWRRVIIVDDSGRREVLLSSADVVRTSLRNEGVNLASLNAVVLTADGSQVDLDSVPAIPDGTLLSVVDLAAVMRTPRPESTSRDATAVDAVMVAWFAAAVLAILAACAGVLSSMSIESMPDIVVRYASAALFGGLSVVAVVATTSSSSRPSPAAFIVPGSLAFTAGFLAIPFGLASAGHLAGFVGLLAAAIAQTAVHARVAASTSGGATSVVALSLTVIAAVWGLTLLTGLPPSAAAALVVGFAPLAVRILPVLVIDVPQGQLLEYASFKQNRWTVRESTPPPSHPVTALELRSTMARARIQFRAGTVLFSLAPALALPFLLATGTADPVARIATTVLVTVIVASLCLSPRRANDVLQRWVPRLGAAIVALEFAWFATEHDAPVGRVLTAAALLLAAIATAAISVPLARGSRSLGVSRFADILESLATVLAFPAAFAAAGLIDILRGAVS